MHTLVHRQTRATLLVCLALVMLLMPFAGSAQAPEAAPGRILVRFAASANAAARAQARANASARFMRNYTLVPGLELLSVSSALGTARAIQALEANPHVLYAEPDYKVEVTETRPNDAAYGALWGMENINAPTAWDYTTGDDQFVVAVIDTGIDYSHPDLVANIWTNPGEIAGNGIDDDNNGYVDDVHGYDFANNDNNPMDDHGHGSHCAGTIGAVGNNAIGVAGVTWRVKLMALKFLDASGSGYTSDAVSALEYATDMGVRVSNNSWGGGGYLQSLDDAIKASKSIGHVFVAAAGNDGLNNDLVPHYPSSYSQDNIIAVAAIDIGEAKASFSNWGASSVDLGAPGVSIYSTVPGGYGYKSGTSMASPHVAGATALLYGLHPEWSYSEVRDQLLNTVRPAASMVGRTATGGVLDVGAASGAPLALAAPSDLAATSLSASEIALSWTDNANDETGQVLERAFVGGAWSELATLAPNMTSYTDSSLSAGDTMQYRIKAVRDGVDSAYSNIAQATTPIPGAQVATADYAADAGAVSGTYLATTSQDDVYQTITEAHQGGKPSNRYDALDHVWMIPLSGDNYVLHVDAYVGDAGDADAGIVFSYATSANGPWSDALTVTANADTDAYLSAPILTHVDGALYVRATDSDRTPGQNLNDTLYVDHLYLDGGVPPTEPPGQATTPDPANGALDQSASLTLRWVGGEGATSHRIHLGTTPGNLAFVAQQSSVGYDAEGLATATTYYWRVDEVNGVGTTTGVEWSFATRSVVGATTLHVQAIALSAPRSAPPDASGQAVVTIVDDLGNPVSGALVTGTFSGDLGESVSVSTDADGNALLATQSVAKKPAYTFCVDDVSDIILTYVPGNNVMTCATYP